MKSATQVSQKSISRIAVVAFSLALVLTASVVVTLTQAQQGLVGQSLEISPPSQEVISDPGQTVQVKAKLRNRTNAKLPIAVRIEDFTADGEEGQVALTEKGPWSVSTWTTVAPNAFELSAGESREVTATVRVPKSGVAGGRYGSIVFSVTGKAEGAGQAAVSQEVASLFLLRVAGDVDERLSVDSMTVPGFLEFGPVPFAVNYSNSGNIHLRPRGLIAVTDMFGRKVADVVVEATNVFPGSKRVVRPIWNTQWLFGKYTASAIIYTGASDNDSVTSTVSFIVFPVRVAVVIGLVLVGIFLLRKRLAKALKALVG